MTGWERVDGTPNGSPPGRPADAASREQSAAERRSSDGGRADDASPDSDSDPDPDSDSGSDSGPDSDSSPDPPTDPDLDPDSDPDPDLAGRSNVLLKAPSLAPATRDACMHLSNPTAGRTDVLAVLYSRSPEDWLAQWRAHYGDPPPDLHVVDVDERARSTVAESARSAPDGVVLAVETPGDLTGLGITISEYLDRRADSGADGRTAVCFDSLTVLLQYVDLQRAFRFLHALTNRVAAAGAIAHFHLEPAAHDRRTLATLETLFDSAVEVPDDETGTWSVTAR